MASYRDPKRYLWLASFVYPLVALAGPLGFRASGAGWWLALPVLLIYGAGSWGGDRRSCLRAAV